VFVGGGNTLKAPTSSKKYFTSQSASGAGGIKLFKNTLRLLCESSIWARLGGGGGGCGGGVFKDT